MIILDNLLKVNKLTDFVQKLYAYFGSKLSTIATVNSFPGLVGKS